jgi:hypothetical protein
LAPSRCNFAALDFNVLLQRGEINLKIKKREVTKTVFPFNLKVIKIKDKKAICNIISLGF